MEFASVVESDVLVDNLFHFHDPFAQFYSFRADRSVDGHHSILTAFFDDFDFLYSLDLLAKQLVAFLSQLEQLCTAWALKRCVSDVLASLIVLLDEKTRFDKHHPCLFLPALTLDSL